MLSTNPNPTRIIFARQRRGLTKIALAGRTGLGARTIYDIEIGKAVPLPDTLAVLSKALRFPVEFFCLGDIEAPSPDAASFRSLRSMTASNRDAALSAGAIALEISRWLDVHFKLPQPAIPDLRDYEPEAAAYAIRAQWGIGERPIGNMIHLLESRGVRVFSLAEHRRVDAFSLWQQNTPLVCLNTVKTAEHSRMDAAHELGHLVLHRHAAPRGRDVEKDAQAFAASFLMPRSSVFAAPRLVAPTLSHLVQLKKIWLVSTAALAHRLHALGLLSDWNYRNLCIQLAKLGRAVEPDGIARETSQILDKVFGPDGRPTAKADVARDLCVHQADVEALIFGLRAEPATGAVKRAYPKPQPTKRQFTLVNRKA